MLQFFANQLDWINQVVGLVWMVLTAIMIGLAWLAYRGHGAGSRAFRAAAMLILAVYAYPIYTNGFQWPLMGLVGNAATIALTTYTIHELRQASVPGAYWLCLQNAWLTVAAVSVGSRVLLESLNP